MDKVEMIRELIFRLITSTVKVLAFKKYTREENMSTHVTTRAAARSTWQAQKLVQVRQLSTSSSKRRKPASSSKSEPVPKRRKGPGTKLKKKPTPMSKPVKVCNPLRTIKVGIYASSLDNLRSKIQKKRSHFPDVGDDFELVLEEDCTAIEDEEYFQTLPNNTVVMAIPKGGTTWMKAPTLASEIDSGLVEVDGQASSGDRLIQLAERINRNPALMAFFPKADLEVLVDADINLLQILLRQSKDDTKFIQDACERRLNELIKTEKAQSLLDLYHRAKSHSKESTLECETEQKSAGGKMKKRQAKEKSSMPGSSGITDEEVPSEHVMIGFSGTGVYVPLLYPTPPFKCAPTQKENKQ